MNQNDLNDFEAILSEMVMKRNAMKKEIFKSQNNWFEMLKLNFESSSQHTPEYLKFHRIFKRQFSKTLKEIGADIVKIEKPNHFDVSGFFQMLDGQIFWFRLEDLRWSKDFLLVRTAKNFNDYTGGENQYCNMKEDYERFIGDLNHTLTGSRSGF